MKFRKKPIVISAWKFQGTRKNGDGLNRVQDLTHAQECDICKNPGFYHASIKTLEGVMRVCPEDWIITGVKGEVYACKPDIFEATYEPAS